MKKRKNSVFVEKLKSSMAEPRDGLMIHKYKHSVLGPTLITEAKELMTWIHSWIQP